MTKSRYQIPSTSALLAFEAAARHNNFSRAAEELYTSQSAISRHIAALESRFNTRLFERRRHRQLLLSEQGEQLYRAVVSGLENIHVALKTISNSSPDDRLTIACTHENSHLFLLPRFDVLQQALGHDKTIRVMTYEYDAMERALDPRIDIQLQYDIGGVSAQDRVAVVNEAIRPVVAPGLIRQFPQLEKSDAHDWRGIPFLKLSKRNFGWATWDEWFAANDISGIEPDYLYFENYVYLLEAAAAGKGVALGWRGLVDRHLETGVLVEIGQGYVEFDRAIHAVLTEFGRAKPLARQCLSCLADLG